MKIPEPTDEHLWLHQLVGNWSYQHESQMAPDQPLTKLSGRLSTRNLGNFWILGEMIGEMPEGGQAESLMTLGYDPVEGQFVGSFIASVMTHLWPYRGTLDAERRRLTLDSQGPSFADDGNMASYQDIIEIVDNDHHRLLSQVQGPDGKWQEFMRIEYERTK